MEHKTGIVTRAIAALLVAALVGVVPVFAAPGEATETPSPTTTPTTPQTPAPPAEAPEAPAAPAAPAAAPRTPPSQDETSPIDVPVDDRTKAFREELARRQARLDDFVAQLDALDRELALAAEAYNAAVDELSATREKVAATEVDLIEANQAYEFQSELLDSRASQIYKQGGGFAAVELLLDSKSVQDFVARVKFLNTIGLADADVAESLRGQKELVEQRAAELEDSEQRAQALEFEMKARQIEVMLRIEERQEMMATAQADLLELLAQEATSRQAEESALMREILSGANSAGITVTPGSPVETAFAYHGIPYLWGGETPSGFDCSGLILYVFKQHGVNLPHYSGSQFLLGEKIVPAALQPGDVVFFGSPIHHVGMYVGGGYFIHAPRTGDFVKLSRLADRKDYAGARRYAWLPRTTAPAGVGPVSFSSVTTVTP